MKLPQGYGSVYKKSGKRRKPWVAVKTIGWEIVDGNAKQKRMVIGYYATKAEGLDALSQYAPIAEKCTFQEVYRRWSEQHYPTLSTTVHYERAYNYLKGLWKKKFVDLKTSDLEDAVSKIQAPSSKRNAKLLINKLYKYALKYDLASVDYSQRFNVSTPKAKIERKPFSDAEIGMLWKANADMILIQIYSGWRASELVSFTDDGEYMYGGTKTEAGKDRIVPIHPLIKNLVATRKKITLRQYRALFERTMQELNMKHATHDCRVTFATKCHLYGVDPLATKKMLGHKLDNITEKVYTKLSKEYLKQEIEKIK